MENLLNKVTTKLNNNVRKALAHASTLAEADPLLREEPAFSHFSYEVDWSNFPNSLIVQCYFKPAPLPLEKSTTSLNNLELLHSHLSKLVQLSLLKQGIKFRDFRKNFTLEL